MSKQTNNYQRLYIQCFVLVIKQDVFRRFYIYGFSQKIILQSVYFYFLNLIFYNNKNLDLKILI
jgi:hypothetical protein